MKIINYYENPATPFVNALPDRAYFIPFADEVSALTNLREESPRMQLLNGNWKFNWYPNLDAVPDYFFAADYDPSDLPNIDVPSCWAPQGYDKWHYIGAKQVMPVDPPYVPVDNPCGTYVVDFDYQVDCALPVTELVFEGVDSAYYVWVNGEFVGYSEVSHGLRMFDISKCLKNGKNRLAVLNLKWSKGTYFEQQDKWRQSGIFRDVYLLSRPAVRLEDFYIHQNIADDYSNAELSTDFTFIGEGGEASIKLYAPDGTLVAEGKTAIAEKANCVLKVDAPLLWSAETPYLYKMVIALPGEVIVQRVGFRTITWDKGVIKVNGCRIRIKGVNRHDTDPATAYAVDREHIIRDLTLMKQNNINAIRTAHYQNSPIVIELCSELGLYVMSEADYETNGLMFLAGSGPAITNGYVSFCPIINDDPIYEAIAMDRMTKNVKRDKNQSSVLFWSLGNESGWGMHQETAGRWIKQYDPTRMLHYENLYPAVDRQPDYSMLDVMSKMYASSRWITEKYGDVAEGDDTVELIPGGGVYTEEYYKEAMKDHPFLQCEYIHAMGNSSGDAEDYFELMEKYERFVGGFVWEWADHAKYIGEDRFGNPMYQYGGDSGEFPTDGNFCMDGLNFPDRRPHTSLKEFKNVIRPIRARWAEVNKVVALRNMLNIIDFKDELYAKFELTVNGEVVQSGKIDLPSCAPGCEVNYELDLKIPAEGQCFLNLFYFNKKANAAVPADFELGLDQLEIECVKPAVNPWLVPAKAAADLSVHETDNVIVVSGANDKGTFEYTFDKKLGIFKFLKVNGKQLLDKPMEYNISRAPTDNDRGFGFVYANWKEGGYYDTVTRVYECMAKQFAESVEIAVRFSMAAIYRGNIVNVAGKWTVGADGMIGFDCDVDRQTRFIFMPRFGIRLFLKNQAEDVTYFGYGPGESYNDKHHYCYRGLFKTNVDELFEDYARPQENGSHWFVQYLNVGSENGAGLQVVPGDEQFSFNVSRYSQEMLENTAHNYELVPSNSTIVCIDYMQSGIGSNSCGPVLLKKYRLDAPHFSFSVKMLPRF